MTNEHLDSPERIHELVSIIENKPSLKEFYRGCYRKYQQVLSNSPTEGLVLELGSGGGFAKDYIPQLITSDVTSYEKVDKVVDAMQLPFEENSLRAVFLLNTFHHIPDVQKFFREAVRCLKPKGRILIIDQHMGYFSRPILKHAHHEPFDPGAPRWEFESAGPLSGANGALAWIVFQRDLNRFEELNPELKLLAYTPHSPLFYWLSGGLKSWSLLPRPLQGLIKTLDNTLVRFNKNFGSFVDVELEKLCP